MSEELEQQETTTPELSKVRNEEALLKAYEATKTEKKQLEKRLKELESTYKGVDIEKYQSLSKIDLNRYNELESLAEKVKEQEETIKVEKMKEEKKWNELLEHQTTKLKTEYENQLKLLSESKQSLEKQLQDEMASRSTLESVNRQLRLQQSFEKEFFDLGGDPVATKYVWQDIEKQVQETDSGLQIVDESGQIKTDGKGNPLTLKDVLSEYKTHPVGSRFFKASQSHGGGTAPQQPLAPTAPVTISQSSLLDGTASKAYRDIMTKGQLGVDYTLVP